MSSEGNYDVCDKTSNNKYFGCPPIMADGRHFTDYRPNCYVNDLLRVTNKTYSSYDYRQFLINNASKLMDVNNMYNYQKNGNAPCNARPIYAETLCTYGREAGSCRPYKCDGSGLKNEAVREEKLSYNPGLQVNTVLAKPKFTPLNI